MRPPSFGSFRRPSPALLVAELPRAVGELGAMAAALPLLRRAPKGDGHPVLVLPGFTADDRSTRPLRWFLRDRGYAVHGWRLGRNLGPTDRVIDGLGERMRRLSEGHGGRTISLVGWSLGGIYAREIARTAPDAVRVVITLGSPFRLAGERGPGGGERTTTAANTGPLYDALRPIHSDRASGPGLPEAEREAVPVPVTNIYTRSDGVAPWRSCVDERGGGRENIEVLGSHSGLGHNPAVLLIVADRLAPAEGSWQPFRGNRVVNRAVGFRLRAT